MSSLMGARDDRKVTPGITESSRPRVHRFGRRRKCKSKTNYSIRRLSGDINYTRRCSDYHIATPRIYSIMNIIGEAECVCRQRSRAQNIVSAIARTDWKSGGFENLQFLQLLHNQDRKSRHRCSKPRRRYVLVGRFNENPKKLQCNFWELEIF